MRIYIVGAAGSGKTTLAELISDRTKTECHHFDDIYYSDEKGTLRAEAERDALFENIINKADWTAEDNGGRACFSDAFNKADKIILLYPNKYTRIKRIISRYIKQKLGFEECSYKPSLDLVLRMIQGSNNFETGADGLKERISKHQEKALVLRNNKDINEYINLLQEQKIPHKSAKS